MPPSTPNNNQRVQAASVSRSAQPCVTVDEPTAPTGYDHTSSPLAAHYRVTATMANAHKVEFERKISRWNANLDLLLIFAGLFSAIISAFVVMSLGDLREDFGKTSAKLLYMIVNNSTSNAENSFHASAGPIWVSALWFSSLSFSLLTGLGAMWGKLWTQERATLVDKFFFSLDNVDSTSRSEILGLDEGFWLNSTMHESMLVGESMTAFLPALMHHAMLLFMTGLAVFVWGDAPVLGYLLLMYMAVGLMLYFAFARLRGLVWYRFLLVPWYWYQRKLLPINI